MRVAIITDQHFGARKNSKHFHDYFLRFYKDIFFPTIEKDKMVQVIDYEHPVFTQSTLEGQAELHALQGSDNTYYAGAHLGFGFHEDGLQSALRVIKWING